VPMKRQYEIQRILFEDYKVCSDFLLYYRCRKCALLKNKDVIVIEKCETISFDTFFNSFSLKKWKKYTNLDNIYLSLTFSGKLKVSLTGYEYRNGSIEKQIFDTKILSSKDKKKFTLSYPSNDYQLLSFELMSFEDDAIIYNAAYVGETDEKHERHVCMALNITTFHREDYVERNISLLEESIFDNSDSILQGHLFVYLTDNGNTVGSRFAELNKYVEVVGQNGTGSSGGFAGGTIRIIRDKEERKITHMIFMDDDIVLDPRVLERNYNFLRFIKEEYNEYVIGSQLCALHNKTFQIEAGAQWNAGNIIGSGRFLDLVRLDHILLGEMETRVDFQGWWYCCVPLDSKELLPLPLYFHRDDVEFGLRQKGFIFINGICVWHDEFENKANSTTEYYDARNNAIVNAIYHQKIGKKLLKKASRDNTCRNIITLRYKDARLFLKGVEDFCKGDDWVVNNDSGTRYDKLKCDGYIHIPSADVPGISIEEFERNNELKPLGNPLSRLGFLLGHFLLPSKYTTTVRMFRPILRSFYRVKNAYNLDVVNGTYYETTRDRGEEIKLIIELLRVLFIISFNYKKVSQGWISNARRYCEQAFWKEHINSLNNRGEGQL